MSIVHSTLSIAMNALYIDPETSDLALSPDGLLIAPAQATIAALVVEANRGELKELPLIGGEAMRRLGSPNPERWVTQLRKQLSSVGIDAKQIAFDRDSNTIQIAVE